MSNDTKGTAIVTGASAGIGAVYADRLARRGYDLVLAARSTAKLQEVAMRIRASTGRTVETVTADLTVRADVTILSERIANDQTITLLVNNAGKTMTGGILENSPENIEDLLALNITAPTLLAAAAGKAFATRQKGGIINISSVLAVAPELFEGVYSGTKAHLLNLSLSLAQQLEGRGVRVQAVLPGATLTEIWGQMGIDPEQAMPGKVMAVDDLVDAALAGFDKGETVTIPPLHDEKMWSRYEAARLAMAPHLSNRDLAERYRHVETV